MTALTLPEFSPLHFFALSFSVKKLKTVKEMALSQSYLLPHFQEVTTLCDEKEKKVKLGWHEEGLIFNFELGTPFKTAYFPQLTRGDSLELFIDTRDVKDVKSVTKFCHHFFLLPKEVSGRQCGEITRFRNEEEAHSLCSDEDLVFEIFQRGKTTTLCLFIPQKCLYGYDPSQFMRMGMTWRLNSEGTPPYCLGMDPQDFPLQQNPAFWPTIHFA